MNVTLTNRTRALLAMSTAAFFFAIMSALTKAITSPNVTAYPLPAGVVAFYRYFGSILVLLFLAFREDVSLLGEDRKALLWRGISGGIASVSYFMSIQNTSLTHAVILNYTSILWGPLFAAFALREFPSRKYLFALPIAIAGVLLIMRPEAGTIRWGDAVGLFSGLVSGGAIVQIRHLRRSEGAPAIFFYFNLVGLPVSLLALYGTGGHLVVPNMVQLPYLVGVSMTSLIAQLLMTYGYREISTAEGGILNLTTNIYSALIAIYFFHDIPQVGTVWGAFLILASAIALIIQRRRA